MDNMSPERVASVARGLRSVDGTSPEYDRAIVEMTTRLLGLPMGDRYMTAVLLGVTGESLRALDDDEPDDDEPVCSWQEQAPGLRPMWARVACSGEVTPRGLGGAPLCDAHVAARAAIQEQFSAVPEPSATRSTEAFRIDEEGVYSLSDCRWWNIAPSYRPESIRSVDCASRMGNVTRRGGTTMTECEAHFNARNGWPT